MSRARLTTAGPSPAKAREILHDGAVGGKPLTPKQRRFMGAMASGKARTDRRSQMDSGDRPTPAPTAVSLTSASSSSGDLKRKTPFSFRVRRSVRFRAPKSRR